MSDLYNSNPANFGGFTPSIIGSSTNKGFYQAPQGLPFTGGRSMLASFPEWQLKPFTFEQSLMVRIREGRLPMMKVLSDMFLSTGGLMVDKPRFEYPVDIEPNQKFYLKTGDYTGTGGVTKFIIEGNTTAIKTAAPNGQVNQFGDVARLHVGQFILLKFSWVNPTRTMTPAYSHAPFIPNLALASVTEGSRTIPEICKITAIDYARGIVTVERNWAGDQRTSAPSVPGTLTVVSSATAETPTARSGKNVAHTGSMPQKYAYFVPMARSMKENEIDHKIYNYSGTYVGGLLQRNLKGFGSGQFAEIIARNIGLQSPMERTKKLAVESFYKEWEETALFGQKSEQFDPETGQQSSTTDGLLANIPLSHHSLIKGIDYTTLSTGTLNLGSFVPTVFNKLMEGKSYIGSQNKVLVCGSAFHSDFSTMLNYMTQQIPNIVSSWNVQGQSFSTSNGMTIEVVPSDTMSLYGQENQGILFDKQYFKMVQMKGYPTDITMVDNENKKLMNGYIEGIKGFVDLNPDAHWVFTLATKTDAGATAYAAIDPLGQPLA